MTRSWIFTNVLSRPVGSPMLARRFSSRFLGFNGSGNLAQLFSLNCIVGCVQAVHDAYRRRNKQVKILSMAPTSPREPSHVPFALYHGLSSHYLVNFRLGETLSDWLYKGDALELYRRVGTELKRLGHAPDWWQGKILAQESGHANWQHGQLYVTPSKASAVRYARGGSAHGGELLQSCRDALDELARLDPGRMSELLRGAESIRRFLEETGQPILIEFKNVRVSGLSPERPSDNVSGQLAELADFDEKMRELMGQQSNFRLAPDCAVVGRVFELSIDEIGTPVSRFELREIVDCDLWTGS